MEVKIVGVPRSILVLVLEALTFILMFRQGVLTTLALSVSVGKLDAKPLKHWTLVMG